MKESGTIQNAIETVLSKLHSRQNQPGKYVSHTVTGDGAYKIVLTNGKITLYEAELRTADELPDFRVPDILARFVPRQ